MKKSLGAFEDVEYADGTIKSHSAIWGQNVKKSLGALEQVKSSSPWDFCSTSLQDAVHAKKAAPLPRLVLSDSISHS